MADQKKDAEGAAEHRSRCRIRYPREDSGEASGVVACPSTTRGTVALLKAIRMFTKNELPGATLTPADAVS
jgi:hypothetical protein